MWKILKYALSFYIFLNLNKIYNLRKLRVKFSFDEKSMWSEISMNLEIRRGNFLNRIYLIFEGRYTGTTFLIRLSKYYSYLNVKYTKNRNLLSGFQRILNQPLIQDTVMDRRSIVHWCVVRSYHQISMLEYHLEVSPRWLPDSVEYSLAKVALLICRWRVVFDEL